MDLKKTSPQSTEERTMVDLICFTLPGYRNPTDLRESANFDHQHHVSPLHLQATPTTVLISSLRNKLQDQPSIHRDRLLLRWWIRGQEPFKEFRFVLCSVKTIISFCFFLKTVDDTCKPFLNPFIPFTVIRYACNLTNWLPLVSLFQRLHSSLCPWLPTMAVTFQECWGLLRDF